MTDYATEAELEGIMIESFDATSVPTTTQITALLTACSRFVDGVAGVSASALSTSDISVKQATLALAQATILGLRQPDKMLTEKEKIELVKQYFSSAWAYSTTISDNDYEE